MANLHSPEFDEPREHDGFRARRARLGHQLKTERIGISLWEIPPGQRAYPYHFHLAEEEESEESVRLLAISTHGAPDVVVYPDSGKLCAAERLPEADGRKHYFRIADEVDYWDGED